MFYTIGTDGLSTVILISSFETKKERDNFVSKNKGNHAPVKRKNISRANFALFNVMKRLYVGGRRTGAIHGR